MIVHRGGAETQSVAEISTGLTSGLSLSAHASGSQKMLRRDAQIAYKFDPRHHFQNVVAEINFPPIKTLFDGTHVVMMIVVPAFAARPKSY
jgi:hypothetical protein